MEVGDLMLYLKNIINAAIDIRLRRGRRSRNPEPPWRGGGGRKGGIFGEKLETGKNRRPYK